MKLLTKKNLHGGSTYLLKWGSDEKSCLELFNLLTTQIDKLGSIGTQCCVVLVNIWAFRTFRMHRWMQILMQNNFNFHWGESSFHRIRIYISLFAFCILNFPYLPLHVSCDLNETNFAIRYSMSLRRSHTHVWRRHLYGDLFEGTSLRSPFRFVHKICEIEHGKMYRRILGWIVKSMSSGNRIIAIAIVLRTNK